MSSNLNLQNHKHFPSLGQVPEDNEVDLSFYREHTPGMLRPSRHWVFLCEITQNISLMRPHYLVKDRDGAQTQVVFYLDNNVKLNPAPYVTGHTLAVFYANTHHFLDGSFGLRLEDMSCVKVIPCALSTLLAANIPDAKSCSHCGASSSDSSALKYCSRCKTPYCNAECQRADWPRHKRLCPAVQQVRAWNERNWNRFDDYWDAF